MAIAKSKNTWALLLLMLAGIVIGGFIGDLTNIGWLNYGQTFGLTSPIVLDLGVLVITFALTIRITIASIIGVIIAILVYRLI
ncbi:MAG: DUF4321 domain-containing protein [Thermoflexaceae bacterium]|nr:DUF4321 domain-containing protein [Thermoflexaceae bacterium]